KALDQIKHRGPDDQRFLLGNNFCLGHVRLSIIDLSNRAAQPMENEQGAIIFNGEIYNYIELKEKYQISASGDTELLFKLIQKISLPKTLDELDGMFAFC